MLSGIASCLYSLDNALQSGTLALLTNLQARASAHLRRPPRTCSLLPHCVNAVHDTLPASKSNLGA